jgi:hypothetical protein
MAPIKFRCSSKPKPELMGSLTRFFVPLRLRPQIHVSRCRDSPALFDLPNMNTLITGLLCSADLTPNCVRTACLVRRAGSRSWIRRGRRTRALNKPPELTCGGECARRPDWGMPLGPEQVKRCHFLPSDSDVPERSPFGFANCSTAEYSQCVSKRTSIQT